ncbi:MAG: hypothetical protein H0T66_15330 [Geodermatophilaceae bacterium]|nr:hypothetical protein [Geodermatophilaceae bacterium]MDQ3456713.1 hypothetical protein [Actinomycetota bacterium]
MAALLSMPIDGGRVPCVTGKSKLVRRDGRSTQQQAQRLLDDTGERLAAFGGKVLGRGEEVVAAR